MHIGASINPIAGPPPPARQAHSAVTAPAPQEKWFAPVRKPSDVRNAEALLLQCRSCTDWQQALPDPRSRRALQAYVALEQIQQRDYVSQVLGIDEYV